MKALIAVEASRRAIYAPKICDLTLLPGLKHTNLNLDFRLLRILRVDGFPEFQHDEDLSQYLQPALEEVYLKHWPSATSFDGLNKYCPRLQVLDQDVSVRNDNQRCGLVEFLNTNRTLRRVRLMISPSDLHQMLAVLTALRRVITLEDLEIMGEISTVTLEQLRDSQHDESISSRPDEHFGSVRRIKVIVRVSALPLLPTIFSAMTDLSLNLRVDSNDGHAHDLDALVGLPLESLRLHVGAGARVPSEELLCLRDTQSLKSLIINTSTFPSPMPKFKVTNYQFKQIFANLSRLETLLCMFPLDIPDPDTALKDLGQSCPKLETIRLYCPIDIIAWMDIPEPVFPSLKFCWFSKVSDRNLLGEQNETTAQLLAEVLDRHAPNMDRFVALDRYTFHPNAGDQLSKMTMRAHGRIKETGQTRHAKEQTRNMFMQ
ncbi:unnamed protein product [Aureobasidium mustum]|uniref:Uncharacterized protein n=1 Tax=Aureobasidium mustum TaxID=2773714 RepID=A0A9N8PNW3_9PEZI|nr:unnamed protein product [Aureobasidium mustum]